MPHRHFWIRRMLDWIGRCDDMNNVENADKPGSGDEPAKAEKSEKDGKKIDWVTRRSSCSLPKIFKELRSQVEEDLKIRNALRPANSPYEFVVVEKGADFSVVLKAKEAEKSVRFSLAEQAISVMNDSGEPMFQVTVTFNEDGECRLLVNERERETWQVRRMALEGILFRG